MKILAIDTATDACSVALLIEDHIEEQFEIAPRQHTKLVLPMVEKLLLEAGLSLTQLTALAVSRGPGSFTGVRIATAVTQGLAYAAELPVVPISTLLALAQTAYRESGQCAIAAAMDARMRQVYWGQYCLGSDDCMQPIAPDTVCYPEKARLLDDRKWWGAGNGWQHYPELTTQLSALIEDKLPVYYPHACDVAKLAKVAYLRGEMVSADKLVPVYLRDKVV